MVSEIIGVDLGVRSVHVSTQSHCFTYAADKKLERYQQIQYIYESMYDRFLHDRIYAFVEEPVVAGARNLRTSLQIAQISGAVLSVFDGTLVPVSTWKKEIVGKGNATKDDIKEYLKTQPEYEFTKGKQDWIDATCIRLYGESVSV